MFIEEHRVAERGGVGVGAVNGQIAIRQAAGANAALELGASQCSAECWQPAAPTVHDRRATT
jgi:hypothetical protein